MKDQVCKFDVLMVNKPHERVWETKNSETGAVEKTGSVHVIRAVAIPTDPNVDRTKVQLIDFNVNTNKTGVSKKNLSDILELYFENKAKLVKGEMYVTIEAYMGGRSNKDGIVTFFSPWVNDIALKQVTESEKPLVDAALRLINETVV